MFKDVPVKQTPLGKHRRVAVNFVLTFEQDLVHGFSHICTSKPHPPGLRAFALGGCPCVPSCEEACCPWSLVSHLVWSEALETSCKSRRGPASPFAVDSVLQIWRTAGQKLISNKMFFNVNPICLPSLGTCHVRARLARAFRYFKDTPKVIHRIYISVLEG